MVRTERGKDVGDRVGMEGGRRMEGWVREGEMRGESVCSAAQRPSPLT